MIFDFKFSPVSLAVFIALVAAPAQAQGPGESLGAPSAPAALGQGASPENIRSAPDPEPASPGVVAETPAALAPAPASESAAIDSPVIDSPAPAEVAQEAAPLVDQPAPVVETASPAPAAPAQAIADTASASVAETAPEVSREPEQKSIEAVAPPPAPSPVQLALREAVELMKAAPIARAAPGQTPAAALRREREAIAAFYEERGFQPLWIDGASFSAAARAAIGRIERARDDGLDLGQYPPPSLSAATPEALAGADLALSQAIVGYARQASGGRVDPRSVGLITVKLEVASPQEALASVSAAADAGAALAAYNPPHQAYRNLREKLGELRRERPAVAAPRIGPGRVLTVGMKDPRVPLVRARFGINAGADNPDEELVYDTRVASAVADFQRAHGLPANGALTARTIALLSGGDPARLEREILGNMERWRWAPRDMGETRIEVNIPDFRARLVRDGKVVHSMRVIVGKPETPTPVFSDTMRFMVVNPSWHVPQSIIRKQLAQDPNYYARNGYEVVQKGKNIFVRQPPGERNALGHVKFMFPNDHAVYMHDTPNRGLFNASRRAFSHGCVRVDQPLRFAEALMPETGWSEQRLRSVIGRGERTIRFDAGVPVHLMYFTAFVDDDGKLQLRDDLYGQSRKLHAALGL
jgi:murein L,D-transpeptidase YcbB/YkuD